VNVQLASGDLNRSAPGEAMIAALDCRDPFVKRERTLGAPGATARLARSAACAAHPPARFAGAPGADARRLLRSRGACFALAGSVREPAR